MNKNKNQIRTGSDFTALVSRSEARHISLLEMPNVFTDKDSKEKYCEANTPTIYVLCNTWLNLVNEVSERTSIALRRQLLEYGLTYTIRDADEIANAIIHEESYLSDLDGYPVWYDCLARQADSADAQRNVLELLRFPKRYSPAYQEDILQVGLDSFLEVNRTRRFVEQHESTDCYLPRVKHDDCYVMCDIVKEVRSVLKGTALDVIANMAPNQAAQYVLDLVRDGFFSAGATAEHTSPNKYLLNKLRSLRSIMPYYKDIHYPWSSNNKNLHSWDMCVVQAVPKSFKTPRIIAKEPAWRNFICSALRVVVINYLKDHRPDIWHYFDVECQDYNREIAWSSSFDLKYATIDISSASDSISAGLGCACFGAFAKVPWLRPSYMRVGKDCYHNNIFLTSGHPLTFLCETIFYYAVAQVATKYTKIWYDKRYKFVEPRVFGDDVELDCRAFDMFISITEKLGIKVNVEKSFTNPSNYRESCGVEYLQGYPMHGLKWPRTTFDWTKKNKVPDYVESLITLQHGTYSRSWRASDFLTGVILSYEPRMTYSKPYTYDTVDLWSDVHKVSVTHPPFGKIFRELPVNDKKEMERRKKREEEYIARLYELGLHREIHAVLRPQYQLKSKDLYDPDLELALYVDFLINGPIYSSPLDKLLNVTTPVDRKPLVCIPQNRWVAVRS